MSERKLGVDTSCLACSCYQMLVYYNKIQWNEKRRVR